MGRPKGDPNHPRRGNGAGWGGPARGAGKPPGSPGAGRPLGVKNGEGKRAQARAALEEAAPLAVQTLINVAADVNDQRAVNAAVAILNRIGLHEKAGLELGGADGGPVVIVTGVPRAEDNAG